MLEEEMGSFAGWYVVMTVNQRKYSISCESVLELVRSDSQVVSKIPKSAPSVRGILNHRGAVLPVIELRSILGERSFTEEVEEMRQFVRDREADHVGWLDDLRECASSGREFKKALDPKLCAFGKWYEEIKGSDAKRFELTAGNIVLEKVLADFEDPHRRIHAIAEDVLSLAKAGEIELAHTKISLAWETDLAQMKLLFNQFFEAFSSLRNPSIVVLKHANHQFAIYVDHVDVVSHFAGDQFEIAPAMAQCEGNLIEYCLKFHEELAMLLDLDALIEVINPAALAA
jgi:chemotaxis signal transduction protein